MGKAIHLPQKAKKGQKHLQDFPSYRKTFLLCLGIVPVGATGLLLGACAQHLEAETNGAWKGAVPCPAWFLGEKKKKGKMVATGSPATRICVVCLVPWGGWSVTLRALVPERSAAAPEPGLRRTDPKTRSRNARPTSRKAAACHVCFHCQNAELLPTVGEKGKGEKSSVETHQTPNDISPRQNKALGNPSPPPAPLGSPPSPHESGIFWANYTGCSEPLGIMRAAKSDIKGANFKINT